LWFLPQRPKSIFKNIFSIYRGHQPLNIEKVTKNVDFSLLGKFLREICSIFPLPARNEEIGNLATIDTSNELHQFEIQLSIISLRHRTFFACYLDFKAKKANTIIEL